MRGVKQDVLSEQFPVRKSPRLSKPPIKLTISLKGDAKVKQITEPGKLSPKKSPSTPLKPKKLPSTVVKESKKTTVSTPRKVVSTPLKELKKTTSCTPVKTPKKLPSTPLKEMQKTPGRKKIESPEDEPKEQKPRNLNIYQQFKLALSTTNTDCLMFRKNEIEQIEQFMKSHLKDKKSSSMYICGPPGTGKTVSVKSVLTRLRDSYKFTEIYLNGMSFTTPFSFYKKVSQELGGKPSGNERTILNSIEDMFREQKKMVVLILDEIDLLNTTGQKLLYTIFEWTQTLENVIIVGIANTLDFTQKTLIRFHSLKMDTIKEISFRPYSREEISGIIKGRIEKLRTGIGNCIDDMAIDFCARKISSYSGDARKALDIMRHAIELVEKEERLAAKEPSQVLQEIKNNTETATECSMVKLIHITKVLNVVFGNITSQINNQDEDYNFPMQQKLALCVMLLLMQNQQKKEVIFGKMYDTFLKVCNERHISYDIANTSDFLSMCQLLESRAFITIKSAKEVRSSKISLKMNEEEALGLFSDKPLFKSILNSNHQ